MSCSTNQCIRAILTEVVISMWYLSPQIKKKLVWEWGRTSLQVRLGVKRKINDKTMFAILRRSRKCREAESPRVDNATVTLCLKSLFSTTAKLTQCWFAALYVHFPYFVRLSDLVYTCFNDFIPALLVCAWIFPTVFSADVTLYQPYLCASVKGNGTDGNPIEEMRCS